MTLSDTSDSDMDDGDFQTEEYYTPPSSKKTTKPVKTSTSKRSTASPDELIDAMTIPPPTSNHSSTTQSTTKTIPENIMSMDDLRTYDTNPGRLYRYIMLRMLSLLEEGKIKGIPVDWITKYYEMIQTDATINIQQIKEELMAEMTRKILGSKNWNEVQKLKILQDMGIDLSTSLQPSPQTK